MSRRKAHDSQKKKPPTSVQTIISGDISSSPPVSPVDPKIVPEDVVSRWESWWNHVRRDPRIYFPLVFLTTLLIIITYSSQTIIQGWVPAKHLACELTGRLCENVQQNIHFKVFTSVGSVRKDPFYLVIILNVLNDSTEPIEISNLAFKINDKVIDANVATFNDSSIPGRSRKNINFLVLNLENQQVFLTESGLSADILNKFRAEYRLPVDEKPVINNIQLPKTIKFGFDVTYTYGSEEIVENISDLGYFPIPVTNWAKQN